jgi:hypothetical protein
MQPPSLQTLADEQRKKTERLRQTASETGAIIPTSTKAKFILNAE